MKLKVFSDLKIYDFNIIQNFADFCKNNNMMNWGSEFRKIRDSLYVFNIDIITLSSEEIIKYLSKKIDRRNLLLIEGRSPSIVDLSYWEIYAPTKEMAISHWNKINKNKSNATSEWNNNNPDKLKGSTIEYQIKKYGEEEGKKRYNQSNKGRLDNNKTSLDYWLNKGYSYDDAVKERKNRQTTFSKSKCIDKYGEEIGEKVWKERQDKWQNTLNNKTEEERIEISLKRNIFCINGYLLRGYTEKDANRLLEERISKSKNNYTSKESIDFFESNFEVEGWLYGAGREWFVWDSDSGKHYFYDFVNTKSKIILEYHGCAWHPNKKILNESQWNNWIQPLTKKTADEKYNFDKYKKKVGESQGFSVFEIYSNDNKETIDNIINQIKNAISKDNS